MFSAIPVHTSIALCLSPWAIERIDRLRRSFVWSGPASVGAGKCKVTWEIVCGPKELGGLGRRFGLALRLRWDWAVRTDQSRTWTDLPSTSDRTTQALFRAATMTAVGDGAATMFWTDSWIQDCCVQQIAPMVFDVVPKTKKNSRTVASGLPLHAWVNDIVVTPNAQLLLQYLELWGRVQEVNLLPGVPVSRMRSFGTSHLISSTPLPPLMGRCSWDP